MSDKRSGSGNAMELVWKRLAEVDTEAGRARLKAYLESQPFPHFEPVPGRPRHLIKVEADGTRTTGRFIGRTFEPEPQGEDGERST